MDNTSNPLRPVASASAITSSEPAHMNEPAQQNVLALLGLSSADGLENAFNLIPTPANIPPVPLAIKERLPWLKIPNNDTIGPENIEIYLKEEIHDLNTVLDTLTRAKTDANRGILRIALYLFGVDRSELARDLDDMITEGKFQSPIEAEQALLNATLFCLTEFAAPGNNKVSSACELQAWALVFVQAKVLHLFGRDGCMWALKCILNFERVFGSLSESYPDLQMLKIRILTQLKNLEQWPSTKWKIIFEEIEKLPACNYVTSMIRVHAEHEQLYRVFLENKTNLLFKASQEKLEYLEGLKKLKRELSSLMDSSIGETTKAWSAEQLHSLPADWDDETHEEKALDVQRRLFIHPSASYYIRRVMAKLTASNGIDKLERFPNTFRHLDLAIRKGSMLAVLDKEAMVKRIMKNYRIPFRDMIDYPFIKMHHAAFLNLCNQSEAVDDILTEEFNTYPASPHLHAFRSPLLGLKEGICLLHLIKTTGDKRTDMRLGLARSECGKSGYLLKGDEIRSEAFRLANFNYTLSQEQMGTKQPIKKPERK